MYERILAALDGSRCSWLVLDEAIRIARTSGGLIAALCVVSDAPRLTDIDSGYVDQRDWKGLEADKASTVLADAETAFRMSGVRGTAQTIDSCGEDVSSVLARAAAECEADLIVMGTHGRHGIRRALLGSVAESLLRTADRPVLLVRDGPSARAAGLNRLLKSASF
ncbi:universal stress protein A [Burkholderia ubonensis]|uniref:universal stress protein n=1 Tax=Burkholderia ubonensis TaxID=101571 RepID=UPI0007541E47|nr:universal stress protein [Burkholderia ubonensis]KVD88026.1 universal stress protein A [Burkholderia ubonensis]